MGIYDPVEMEREKSVVLVVDDYRDQANLYAQWLREEFDVRTAYGGDEALELLDEHVRVALLDRRMPQMTGDDLLATMRDRGYSGYVAMVSAVDPDVDIVEMGFENYLVKPVGPDELLETVEQLLALDSCNDIIRECYAAASKLTTLRAHCSEGVLEDSGEYQRLKVQFQQVTSETQADLEDLLQEEVTDWIFEGFNPAG